MTAWLAAVPTEIAGLPTWALNGLSISSLVIFILIGLGTSRLWTKRQVDELVKQHEREQKRVQDDHTREMTAVKERYETHLTRTVQLLTARHEDALAREKEWRETALQLQQAVAMFADHLEPIQAQSETMLRVLAAWQTETKRLGGSS